MKPGSKAQLSALRKIQSRLVFLAPAMIILLTTATCGEARNPVAVIGSDRNVVQLEVAQTSAQIQRGLMYRTSMPEDAGMVFLFDPSQVVTFWMYHTLIPLDMIFIKDGKILKICENVPPCRTEDRTRCPLYPSSQGVLVTEVVEVNAGYCRKRGVKEGQPVLFTLHPPARK